MKKNLFPLYVTFVLSAVACLCISCKEQVEPQYHIGVSQCLDDAWRQKMNYEMNRELLLYPELQLTTRVADGNNELQCAQIDSFIAEGVDLLIVSPNEAEAVKPAVTRAYRAGIPVIVADRRVTGDEWTAFIGGDNYKVGQLMATWIINEQARTVLEVVGLPGSTPATLRHKGMMEGLSAKPVEIHTVLGDWLQESAEKAVSNYLDSHGLPDVIVAQNDLMALGAAEAVTKSQAQIPIMGVDGIIVGLKAIDEGTITCSATYSSRGDMVIATASRILKGQPFVRDTVLETTLVDRTAAKALLIQHYERMHDLETMHELEQRSMTTWQKMQTDRILLVICVILVSLLFCIALAYIMNQQSRLQSEIEREVVPQLGAMQEALRINQKDKAFSERLQAIVDSHLTDPDLNVEKLSDLIHLSRTQVFRRVKAVTGKGPLEYIRERRLKKADELLHNTDMTVQQVAKEFCFLSAGYFAKCYKNSFGHLPSER
ncbi:MAG: substrate-binding domain-containing protein [Paludibacteraceae bacterium]|nr:substrate-binding domain-containing protein [Paludibacteraceae bacterium]